MALAATDSARTRSARAFARAEKSFPRKHHNELEIRLRLLHRQLESCAIVQPRLYDSAMQGTEPPIPIPVPIPEFAGDRGPGWGSHPRFQVAGDRGSTRGPTVTTTVTPDFKLPGIYYD